MTPEPRDPVPPPKPPRIWVIGLGTVGEWVLRALCAGAGPLAGKYGVRISVVGVASARDGFGGLSHLREALGRRASPVGKITIIGPGAGPELAGQGVLSDLISVARWSRRN